MADYTEEFELAWKTYGPVKNSSKTKAFQAFKKLNGSKPPTDVFVAEITCYNNWLEAQSKKSGKEYPKCHMATWINQRRFESFEIEAKELLSRATEKATDSDNSSWAHGPAGKLSAAIGKSWDAYPGIAAWIKGTRFFYAGPTGTVPPNVPHPHIECPSEYHRSELENRFGTILRKAFGDDLRIIAVKKQAQSD